MLTFASHYSRRGVRVVEGARLESVYTPKVYRGFESRPLRFNRHSFSDGGFFIFTIKLQSP